MNTQIVLLSINLITIATLLFSIIYTAGIVWRVEKKLDISYKFFLAAIIFIFAAEIFGLFFSENIILSTLITKIMQMLFAICFLIGVLLMRDIVRNIDGEK